NFSLKIIREGIEHITNGGIIGLMMPHKPKERRQILEREIKNLGLTLKTDGLCAFHYKGNR
ncbi:hypothetical protein KKP88_00130, partial [Methanothermococcus sp. SCGC AD-155-K20]|nr:hypothetical protein [Methanothermococcus sp. SCGC AD-155-K20]